MNPGVDVPAVRTGHRRGAFAAHAEWRGEADGAVHWIVDMTAHIAKGAGAIVEPLAPIARMVIAVNEVILGGHSTPCVPVHSCRYFILFVRTGVGVAPFFAAPSVHFGDFTNCSLMYEFDSLSVNLAGMNLNSHLGGKVVG